MNSVDKKFYEIFEDIEREADEIKQIVSAVEVMSDHKLYNHYLKKLKKVEKIVDNFKCYKKNQQDLIVLEQLFETGNDAEFRLEIEEMQERQRLLFEQLKSIYAESENAREETVIIEISSKDDLEFVKLIESLIQKYSESQDYSYDCLMGETVTIKIKGNGVFDKLKVFSGKIKKVERGNETFATVVVLIDNEENIIIQDKDLIIQTSRSGGAGGQHINKTESAVKIIHVPTGIYAECQDERSQTKNKEKAMQALADKIMKKSQQKSQENIKSQREVLKSKIFATTPEMVFDLDTNKVVVTSTKIEYKLQEILKGNLDIIINNQIK